MKYDNPYWEHHLPVNPPIDFENAINVDGTPYTYVWHMDSCDLANWNDGTIGNPDHVYRSRLREDNGRLDH